eukprot:TRINITY_DN9864_c0_g1_i1.p1 TRINITY_DN9864_c0_g1~~TRINITY_DN9864_c0_g1_i1.p1  ORF type:complete len:332 (+),score=84.36 TRINITY_DN9864_c0_g1_i1:50-1045(+)
MKKQLLCLILVLVVVLAKKRVKSKVAQDFDNFVVKFEKVYDDEDEYQERFAIFQDNLKTIQKMNSLSNGGAVFGINKYSDLTATEFKNYYLMNPLYVSDVRKDVEVIKPKHNIYDPAKYDWREHGAVTPVKDQGQCGSCWAFSTTENIESVWILGGKGNVSDTRFSPQQIVDCDKSDLGCNGGNPPTAYEYVINAGGIEADNSYPYTAQDGTCKFEKSKVVGKISGWKYATSRGDEATLKKNLLSHGPLSICVDAAYWQHYSSGVMTSWQCAWINQLDHCVQLVGYDTGASTPYWIVRNSWGTSWGNEGYIWLEMGDNTCGLTNEASTATL